MKVQTRLSLVSSVVFGIVFAGISILIYSLFYSNSVKDIYKGLEKTAILTAFFYLEEDELSREEFSKIKAQFDQFVSNTYYQIYNEADSISYGAATVQISRETLELVRNKEKLQFRDNGYFCYGIFYPDNQGDFVVVSKERESDLQAKLQLLIWILLIAFVIGITLIVFLSKMLAFMAYRPFRNVIEQVNRISTNNLDTFIHSSGTKDELQDLIDTFNKLLQKIAETVSIQKNFVKYVSHEFNTPLASLLGNLEVFVIKDRTPKEYEAIAKKMIHEITQLQEILDALIIISDLRKISDTIASFRVDELLWDIISRISERYNFARIVVNMDIPPESENILSIDKDRTQLLMAFYNLIENAVKYSKGGTVEILMNRKDEYLCIAIKDNGIGIPPDQLKNISKPFFRADNTNQIQGSGIGLSIALRILEKNRIRYEIESITDHGTTITVFFV